MAMISFSAESRFAAVFASRFSRSTGSVLLFRTLHHQSAYSIVMPSSRSCFPSANFFEIPSIAPSLSSTWKLISPVAK